MIKDKLKNGTRFIYEKRDAAISSFCIGFDAGALREEEGFKYGTAHALEHMLYKGTLKRSEDEINSSCDSIFGFNNAMTNYPYVIYYGTSLTGDFEAGLELYGDIVLNPAFPEKGFQEELSVICEELRDWQEDLAQYCEDKLLSHAFDNRRIMEPIIGSEASVRSIGKQDLISFYNKFYIPANCVITMVTSLQYQEAFELADKYFGTFKSRNPEQLVLRNNYQHNIAGVFTEEFKAGSGARIQYCFSIHNLTVREIKVLKLFNFHFGESVTSILYDEIRTKNGLVYDISSYVKNETGIRLFTISASTSIDNVNKVVDIINSKIEKIKSDTFEISQSRINNIIKMLKIKREMLLEKSIQLCKELTVHELMYGSPEQVFCEFEDFEDVTSEEIHKVIVKTFRMPTIQILK